MRHDQLLPILPGEDSGTYTKRMVQEFRLDVPVMELQEAARGRWYAEKRERTKAEILALLENPNPDASDVAHLLRRVITELL